jgi:hypothetical protein
MAAMRRSTLLTLLFSCWNWKCALFGATVRSLVYLAAMVHARHADMRAVVLVEMVYVTLTAGIFAALQQRSLGIRSRFLGDMIVVVGVPSLAQILDWTAHRVTHAVAPGRAILIVCLYTLISALFHLHFMRNGVLLTGCGRSLGNDVRRIPRLVAGFASTPFVYLAKWSMHFAVPLESDDAL